MTDLSSWFWVDMDILNGFFAEANSIRIALTPSCLDSINRCAKNPLAESSTNNRILKNLTIWKYCDRISTHC